MVQLTGMSIFLLAALWFSTARDILTILLFWFGIFYLLAALFVVVVLILTWRALHFKDAVLVYWSLASILYTTLWVLVLRWGLYIYTFDVLSPFIAAVSIGYAIVSIGLSIVGHRRRHVLNQC